MDALHTGLTLIIAFPILLLAGIPISITIGLSSVLAVFSALPIDNALITSAQRLFSGIDSFSLLAIPFFVLSGVIMNNGGIALKLVNFAKLFGARVPGALSQTNVVANMLFGSISGSGTAACAAMGSVLGPIQEKDGYDKNFAAAVNIASAPTGLLIPPSNSLIIFSLASGGASVAALFTAGYIPGILWGLALMIVAFFIAKKKNYPVAGKTTFKEKVRVTLDAIPSLLLIVIIIGGIIGGIFTATEGACIAVIYTLFLSMVCYRTITFKTLPKIFLESAKMTAIIMLLIAASSIMSWIMAFTNIPTLITNAILGISSNKIVLLIVINIMLLIVGTFMDLTPAILIFTPILLPIVKHLGMNTVQFGIMLVFNLSIGTITPPVGNTLFVGCKVAKTKLEKVIKPLIPMFIALMVVLLLVTFVPGLSLWIPKMIGLIK